MSNFLFPAVARYFPQSPHSQRRFFKSKDRNPEWSRAVGRLARCPGASQGAKIPLRSFEIFFFIKTFCKTEEQQSICRVSCSRFVALTFDRQGLLCCIVWWLLSDVFCVWYPKLYRNIIHVTYSMFNNHGIFKHWQCDMWHIIEFNLNRLLRLYDIIYLYI